MARSSRQRVSFERNSPRVRGRGSKSRAAYGQALVLKPMLPIGYLEARGRYTCEVGPELFSIPGYDQFQGARQGSLEQSQAFFKWWCSQVENSRHFVIQIDEPLETWSGNPILDAWWVVKFRFYFVVTDFCVLCVGVDYMEQDMVWHSTGTVNSSFPLHYVEGHSTEYVLVGVEDWRRRVNWDSVECQQYQLNFTYDIGAATHNRNPVPNDMFITVIPYVEKIVADSIRDQAGNVSDIVPVFLLGHYQEIGNWNAPGYTNVVQPLASPDKWFQVLCFRSGRNLEAYTYGTTRWYWEMGVSPSWSMVWELATKLKSQAHVLWSNGTKAPVVSLTPDSSSESFSEESWPELRGFSTQYFDNIGMFVPNLYSIDVVGTELLIQLIHRTAPAGQVETAMLGMVLLDKATPYDTLQEELGWEVLQNMPFPGLVKRWVDHAKRVTQGMLWPRVYAFGRTVKPIVSPGDVAAVQAWYRDNVANQAPRHGRTYRPYSGLPIIDFDRAKFDDLLQQLLEKGYVKAGFLSDWYE